MTFPISESNPKIQCQYVLLKEESFFFIKTNRKQIRKGKTKQIENKKQKRGKSPHTPTLYPCIVLNVFNMYKMQKKV